MEISKTEIGNALTSADDNHILATANDIYDEEQQAYQSEINQSLKEGKQDKLVSGENIKTVNGISLLGSGDISIEGGDSTGDVDEGRLVWSDDYAPAGTLLDNIMKISGNNVLAFMPPSAITIEYSTDNGVTWLDYGWNDKYKTVLVTPEFGNNGLFLGKSSSSLSSNNRLRITFDFIAANMRFTPSKACIYFSRVDNSDSFYTKLLIEKYNNYNNDVWEELANQKITTADWGTFRLPTEDWGYKGGTYRARFRCEFYRTSDSVNNTAIGNVIIMATKIVTANSYTKNHHLYTFDLQQNVTFPNAIKGKKLITDGGKSTQVVKGDGSLEEESNLAVASAIDAEHAEEADYAGVADKADKLTNARTIALSGGARGEISFDGSANKSLDVTTLYEAYMSYGGKAIVGDVSPIDGAAAPELWCNKFAYYNPDYINVEYTNNYSEDADGNESSDVIWTEYPYASESIRLSKLFALVTGGMGNFYSSGSNSVGTAIAGKTRLRVTFNTYSARYIAPKKLLIHVGASVPRLKNQIKVEVVSKTDYDAGNTDKFTHYSTNVVSGDDGWNSMSFASSFGNATYATFKKLRITFIVNGVDPTNRPPALHNIYMIGKHYTATDDKLAASGHFYKYDYQKNMEIPAALAPMTSKTQNIGYASRPWKNVYAQKYVTDGGTNQQAVLGDGSLIPLSELSPITDADAEILLDNHIHSIDVNANGNNVNISVIESSKNGNTWETEEKNIPLPVATQGTAGIISAADKKKIDNINYEDNTLFVGDGMDGTLAIGHESSKASAEMRVFRDRQATIHTTSYNDTSGGSLAVMEAYGGKGRMEVNGDQLAELALSGAGTVRTTLTKENEDGTKVKTIIDAEEGITAPKLATIGGTSEQILLGDGTLITFDELKAKLGLI